MIKTNLPAFFNIDLAAGTNIDWSQGNSFYNNISANKTYTFSNVRNGNTVILLVKNTSGSTITLILPSNVNNSIILTVAAGKTNVYTFIRSNGFTYAAVVDGMS